MKYFLGMTEDEKMQLAARKMQEKFQAEAEGKSVSCLSLNWYKIVTSVLSTFLVPENFIKNHFLAHILAQILSF